MTRAELDALAERLGLRIASYNPGDNPRFKIVKATGPVDYHATYAGPVYRTRREVKAFLDGYESGRRASP